MRRRLRLLAGAAVAGLLLAPAGSAGTSSAAAPFAAAWAKVPRAPAGRRAKSILVFGVGTDVDGFNTALACCNLLQAGFMGGLETTRGAFEQNAKGAWIEDVVTRASADARGVSYTIRPNAYWYWGGRKLPVTYRDFVYTLRKLDDPQSLVSSRAGYANLDPTRFTHHGPKQVTFFWKRRSCSADFPCGPYADWKSIFSSLYPAAALAGEDFNTIWSDCICGYDGKPVSDGPFYLSNYTPGQGSTLKANPYFYGRRPGLAEVDMKIVASADSEVQALRGGELDAIAPPFGNNLLPLAHTPGITFTQVPSDSVEHVEFREAKGSSNALLRAPWLRQAIALGLDRRGIVKAALGELGAGTKPLESALYFPGQPQYRPDFARWDYDPARALALLAKHCTGGPSVPSAANTAIWQCDGLPVRFDWAWTAGVSARTAIGEIAQAELKAIGIDVVADPLPADVLFGPTSVGGGRFDVAQFADIGTGDPGDWYDTWRCGGPANFTGYCSRRVSDLLQRGSVELDPAKRAADYRAADRLMAAKVPVIPLYQRPNPLAYRSDIRGMSIGPGVFGPVWNIEDWRWR